LKAEWNRMTITNENKFIDDREARPGAMHKAAYRTVTAKTMQAFRIRVLRETAEFIVGPDQQVLEALNQLMLDFPHDRLTFALIAETIQTLGEDIAEYSITDLNGNGVLVALTVK
jgi:hypothetical protein